MALLSLPHGSHLLVHSPAPALHKSTKIKPGRSYVKFCRVFAVQQTSSATPRASIDATTASPSAEPVPKIPDKPPVLKDITTTSLWLANAGVSSSRSVTKYPKLPKDETLHYDVVVIGAGIVGVQTAYNLKKLGKKVALVEARNIGGGTTSFSTAKLSSLQGLLYSSLAETHGEDTAKLYYEMNQGAIDTIERIDGELGLQSEFERRPHTLWTGESLNKIKTEYFLCQKLGISCELYEAEEVKAKLSPNVIPVAGLSFKDQAQFNSYKYCTELTKHVSGDGSAVFENSLIHSVSETVPHKVSIDNDAGVITGDYVVLATHLPFMDQSLHFAFLKPSRSHCVAVRVAEKSLKEMFLSAEAPTRSLRTSRGDDIVVVCGEAVVMGEDAETEKYYVNLEYWARQNYDVVEVVARWSAMDYYSADHIPFAGYLHRGTDSIFTATGFSKWGLTTGVAAADVITDLIMGKENRYHAMVDARRWSNQLPGLAQEGPQTASHFVGDKVKNLLSTKPIEDLKIGEGAVVKAGLDTVGAYVDENGKRHCVRPICTHLACDLVFNQGDRVWDCPCHGSQFDVDGKVLHGPGTKNLDRLEYLE